MLLSILVEAECFHILIFLIFRITMFSLVGHTVELHLKYNSHERKESIMFYLYSIKYLRGGLSPLSAHKLWGYRTWNACPR